MIASFVFLTVAQHKNLNPNTSAPSNAKIPVGADVAKIGKLRPGHYVADRDLKSLPKVSDYTTDKLQYFTGKVYVLSSDAKTPPTITMFQSGRMREFHKETGKVDYNTTLHDYLASMGGSDVRLADANYAEFEVLLPTEAKKLDGFDGSLTFFLKDIKPEQALTITLKKGKVVSTRP